MPLDNTHFLLIGLLVLAIIAILYIWNTNSGRINELDKELDNLKNLLKQSNQSLLQLTEENTKLLNKINSLTNNLDDANSVLTANAEKMSALQTEINGLQSQLNNYNLLVNNIKLLLGPVGNNLTTDTRQYTSVVAAIDSVLKDMQDQIKKLTNAINSNVDSNEQRNSMVSLLSTYGNSFVNIQNEIDRWKNETAVVRSNLNTVTAERNRLETDLNNMKKLVDTVNTSISNIVTSQSYNPGDTILIPTGQMLDVSNPNNPNIVALSRYVSVTRSVFERVLELSKIGISDGPATVQKASDIIDIMNKYNAKVQNLQTELDNLKNKYTKVGNRIPVRYLRNTYLFDVDINGERPAFLNGVGWNKAYNSNVTHSAPNLCDNNEICSSFTYPSSAGMPVAYRSSRGIHERDAGNSYPMCSRGGRVTQILRADVSRDSDGAFRKSLYEVPNNLENLIGSSSIRVADLVPQDPIVGISKNFEFDVMCAPDTGVIYNAGYQDGSNFRLSPLYKPTGDNNKWSVMVSKPELVNWGNYGYNSSSDTVDLSSLNNSSTGSNGILFRQTELFGKIVGVDRNVTSFSECQEQMRQNGAQAMIMSRKADRNGNYYCSTRGTTSEPPTLARNKTGVNSSMFDVYIRPGANVNFDF